MHPQSKISRFKRVFPLYLCSYPTAQRKAHDGLKNRYF